MFSYNLCELKPLAGFQTMVFHWFGVGVVDWFSYPTNHALEMSIRTIPLAEKCAFPFAAPTCQNCWPGPPVVCFCVPLAEIIGHACAWQVAGLRHSTCRDHCANTRSASGNALAPRRPWQYPSRSECLRTFTQQ
jgi:hypothetical protein